MAAIGSSGRHALPKPSRKRFLTYQCQYYIFPRNLINLCLKGMKLKITFYPPFKPRPHLSIPPPAGALLTGNPFVPFFRTKNAPRSFPFPFAYSTSFKCRSTINSLAHFPRKPVGGSRMGKGYYPRECSGSPIWRFSSAERPLSPLSRPKEQQFFGGKVIKREAGGWLQGWKRRRACCDLLF